MYYSLFIPNNNPNADKIAKKVCIIFLFFKFISKQDTNNKTNYFIKYAKTLIFNHLTHFQFYSKVE
jgi:hypothetical protein